MLLTAHVINYCIRFILLCFFHRLGALILMTLSFVMANYGLSPLLKLWC